MGFSPEVQEILDRVKSGEDRPKRVRYNRSARVPGAPVSRNPRPAPPVSKPKHDHQKMIELYEAGERVGEIARLTGSHRGTVCRVLNKAGIDPSDRKGGPLRREMCAAGLHSMEDAPEMKNGGRGCAHCKNEKRRKVQDDQE